MTDRYVWGDVTRLSPDAPVPVVRVTREEDREGAALNVAHNVNALGSGCVVLYSKSQRIVKLRLMGRNHHIARIDYDYPQDPVDKEAFALNASVSDYVIFCDYGKGSLSEIEDLIRIAKDECCYVMVDPKGHDWRRYKGADLIKPNAEEMKELVGGWSSDDELCLKARRLMKDSGIGAILLTRGSQGMVLIEDDEQTYCGALAENVVCVSGAGESAIAAMAVALEEGYTLREAIVPASEAAAVAVSRFGTTVVKRREVFAKRPRKTLSLAT